MSAAQQREIRLRIIACRHVYTGTNVNNHQYSIFEVDAAKPDGTMVNEKLRSFEALPIGQEMDLLVEAFNSERYGRSFTLHRKDSTSSTDRLNALDERVGGLAQKLEALATEVANLKGQTPGQAPHAGGGW